MFIRSRVLSLLMTTLACSAAWTSQAIGADLPNAEEAVVLVAKPQFRDPVYGETILIARPVGEGGHVGFILNKPAHMNLGTLLSERDSRHSSVPLYLGGPAEEAAVFALVETPQSPGRGSLQISSDLFLVIAQDTVTRVIETEPEHARFFTGVVVWRPGELANEVKQGAWYVLSAERDLVLEQKTEGLWQRLVHLADLRENGI